MPSIRFWLRTLASIFSLLSSASLLALDCGRDCLTAHITQYLNAMQLHDPSLLEVTDDVRFTEDDVDMPLGDGLWANIEMLGSFRQDIIDVRNQVAGVHFVAYENGNPVLAAIRLKLKGGLLSEVESTVVRSQEEGVLFKPDGLVEASQTMNMTPAAEQLNTREEMINLTLLYPEGLRVGSFVTAGTPFAPNAYHFQNGLLMAGPGCTFSTGCENIREQRLPTLSGIRAQVAAVDEEQGIVWLRMNFGPGSIYNSEGELSVWEMYKVYDGRINAVESFMEEIPPGMPSSWAY